MSKEMFISSSPHETKVAVLEDDQLVEVYFERDTDVGLVGSIYKGRVSRVLPGMQSAFVDIGLERDAFLYVSDFFLEDQEEYDKVFEEAEARAIKAVSGEAPTAQPEATPAAAPEVAVRAPAPEVAEADTVAVAPQTSLALVGTNGSGKATLLKSIVGLIPPIAGSVEGHNVEFAGPALASLTLDDRATIATMCAELSADCASSRPRTVVTPTHQGRATDRQG